jgi:hypothetical protein
MVLVMMADRCDAAAARALYQEEKDEAPVVVVACRGDRSALFCARVWVKMGMEQKQNKWLTKRSSGGEESHWA